MRLAVSRAAGVGATIVIDEAARMPGRGAYLCAGEGSDPNPRCLALALRRSGPQRTLRSRASLDPKLVESVSP